MYHNTSGVNWRLKQMFLASKCIRLNLTVRVPIQMSNFFHAKDELICTVQLVPRDRREPLKRQPLAGQQVARIDATRRNDIVFHYSLSLYTLSYRSVGYP